MFLFTLFLLCNFSCWYYIFFFLIPSFIQNSNDLYNSEIWFFYRHFSRGFQNWRLEFFLSFPLSSFFLDVFDGQLLGESIPFLLPLLTTIPPSRLFPLPPPSTPIHSSSTPFGLLVTVLSLALASLIHFFTIAFPIPFLPPLANMESPLMPLSLWNWHRLTQRLHSFLPTLFNLLYVLASAVGHRNEVVKKHAKCRRLLKCGHSSNFFFAQKATACSCLALSSFCESAFLPPCTPVLFDPKVRLLSARA